MIHITWLITNAVGMFRFKCFPTTDTTYCRRLRPIYFQQHSDRTHTHTHTIRALDLFALDLFWHRASSTQNTPVFFFYSFKLRIHFEALIPQPIAALQSIQNNKNFVNYFESDVSNATHREIRIVVPSNIWFVIVLLCLSFSLFSLSTNSFGRNQFFFHNVFDKFIKLKRIL